MAVGHGREPLIRLFEEADLSIVLYQAGRRFVLMMGAFARVVASGVRRAAWAQRVLAVAPTAGIMMRLGGTWAQRVVALTV
jgi:hypothetical protein